MTKIPKVYIISIAYFTKVISGNYHQFSETILNQPNTTVDEFNILILDYFNGFGEFLISMFKIPMELKNSTYLLDLPKSHKIYKYLINNAL